MMKGASWSRVYILRFWTFIKHILEDIQKRRVEVTGCNSSSLSYLSESLCCQGTAFLHWSWLTSDQITRQLLKQRWQSPLQRHRLKPQSDDRRRYNLQKNTTMIGDVHSSANICYYMIKTSLLDSAKDRHLNSCISDFVNAVSGQVCLLMQWLFQRL